ncbi:MAG TPA: acyl carrier protein [Patescibacteria group bacterium]|nr:acyl carrier protein [Patescibacteria group bacterium]
MDEVTNKVHNVIGTHLGVPIAEVKNESYLQDDLNADQLALADIVVTLEEEFSLKIPQEEIIKFNKVGDIVTYISENLNEL